LTTLFEAKAKIDDACSKNKRRQIDLIAAGDSGEHIEQAEDAGKRFF